MVSLYFFYDFLSIVSLKQWLLYCCYVWPLCQGRRADWGLPQCLCGHLLIARHRCLHVMVVRKGLGSTCGRQLVHLLLCWVLQGTRWSVTQKAWSSVRQQSAFCSCSGNSGCSAPPISMQHAACCRPFRSLELYCEALWLSSWHTFPCKRVSAALLSPSCSPLFFSSLFPFSCLS